MCALCLTPWLNGCASDPVITSRIEIQRVPESLTVPCQKSILSEKTYQGAIALAEARGKDLDECSARMADIRKWSAQ